MVTPRIRRVAGTLFVLGAVSFASDRATMQTPGAMRLAAVEVSGSQRISKDDVVKLSGLKIGEEVTPAALDPAANRINSTGLFRSVQYRYTTANGKLDAIFELEDEAWTLPVVFDNFVWFQDSEVLAAVTRDVPTFNGTLPANETASQYVAGVLTRLLASRQLQGRVTAAPRINLVTNSKQLLFRVVDASTSLKMCAVRMPRASAVPEADLQQAAQSALGGDYSRAFVTDLASGTLRQVYLRRGYWEATVAPASAALDAGCPGVTVTFQVQEGAQYVWDHAEWTGTAALPSPDLDRAMNMKAGGVAGLNELEAGLRGVHGAYEKVGYIAEQADYEASLDTATHHATFKIKVAEHQQFHMGTIAIAGGAAGDDAAKKWKLRPGDVYDGSYLEAFTAAEIRPRQQTGALPRTLQPQVQVDPDKLIVNVRFVVQ
jgi:outer membrane protein insertion porin family